MKHLISLLAFSLLIGCDGEKSNTAPSERSPKEAASETKSPEAVSVNPNLKYKIEGDAVTITGCDKKALGDLIIPAKIEGKPVTSIGNSAFQSSTNLTSITNPDSVISIGDEAFFNCTSLTSITIPDGVTSIGDGAFWDCTNLTSITIPDSVTSIGSSAFRACTSLPTIEVSTGNANYMNVEVVLFNKEKTLLHTYPAGKAGANYVIPDSVNSIGDGAFVNCTSLTSVSVSNGVTSIKSSTFWGCASLTNITIPDDVTSIEDFAFFGCTSLTDLTILGDAPKIENDAFLGSSPTIYRKADAKGWGDTLAGRPVKLITEKP